MGRTDAIAGSLDRRSHLGGLGQSLVSHHLRILREAGLVMDRREGRWVYYAIVEPALTAARQAVQLFELVS